MLKKLKDYFLSLFLIIISLVFLATSILTMLIHKPGPLEIEKTILIKAGISSKQVAITLEKEGIIKNKFLFLFYAKTINKKLPIRAGEYKFKKNITLIEVLNLLKKGESVTRKIVFQEGLSSYLILKILTEEPTLSGSIDEIPEEGSLFPSTYNFKYGDLRNSIIRMMKKKMEEIATREFNNMKPSAYIKNVNDLITLASIIEKEAGNDYEKPLISAVFHNRLKKGMKLQADPTVIYGLTIGRGSLGRPLNRKDLETKTEYNTYVIKGLPIGPISCPGEASIKAAAKPADSDAIYFVVNGKGGHNFSNNYEQHNIFVNQYRQNFNNISN